MGKLRVDLGNSGKFIDFGPGSRSKTVRMGDGFSVRTADFIFADGSKHRGMVNICDQDHGELYHSTIYLPEANDIIEQDQSDFAAKLGKTSTDIFPYRYRYNGWRGTDDWHIGDDGWSN